MCRLRAGASDAASDMHNAKKEKKNPIRLGRGDEKDKETEVTWFCSWLSSDAEADGSGQNCKARRLHRPRLHSGERRERKEFVQAHGVIYSSTGTGERAWEGSQGCAAGVGQRESRTSKL